jgi:hypothetical protein
MSEALNFLTDMAALVMIVAGVAIAAAIVARLTDFIGRN